jgi:hypothetical protein
MEPTINVTKNSSLETVIEVWMGNKKITAYLPPNITILLVEGTGKDAEITDEKEFYEAWEWLNNNTKIINNGSYHD